jgi:hypothetical protein
MLRRLGRRRPSGRLGGEPNDARRARGGRAQPYWLEMERGHSMSWGKALVIFVAATIVGINSPARASSSFNSYAAYCGGATYPIAHKLLAIRTFPLPPATVAQVMGIAQRFTRFNTYTKSIIALMSPNESMELLDVIVQGSSDTKLCSEDLSRCVAGCITNECANSCFRPGPRSCQASRRCWRDGPLPPF